MDKKNNVQNRKQKKKNSIWFTGFFFAILFCTFFGVFGNVQRHQSLLREKTSIESQITAQEELQLAYELQKEYLRSDVYIEQIAREQLGMVKPNEVLYIEQGQ